MAMTSVRRTCVAIAVTWAAAVRPSAAADFMRAADLSEVQYIQDHGVRYRDGAGHDADPLVTFRRHGGNTVRLRLFVAPDGTDAQVNTLPYTLGLAKRARADGLAVLLDLHYSDGWADPTHQVTPAAWRGLSHAQLVDRVRRYTRDTLAAFADAGATPDVVEVGNEVTNGMLWPDGGPLSPPARWNDGPNTAADAVAPWDRFADLLKAGVAGVRDADPGRHVRVMIHVDEGGSPAVARDFFDHVARRGVDFDLIGLSYYPFWHGPLDGLRANLAGLAAAYGKDVVVVETGYDTWGGPRGTLPFPLTPDGQRAFVADLVRTVAATPGGHGGGVCYWAAGWIDGNRWGGPAWSGQWEQRALFDAHGDPRPALDALGTTPATPVTGGRLPTRWAADVSPTDPWPEYPRPQLVRKEWRSLNGPWDYALADAAATATPAAYDGRIRVPFPYEAALSGVGRPSPTDRRLWYRRTFAIPADWRTAGRRVLLHFGAVNWEASVRVNGRPVGEHRGGYDSFDFDVTDALRPSGDNELVMAVRNPLTCDTPDAQMVGKQRAHPGGVLYTAATGIWQTVWVEPVPARHVTALSVVPDVSGKAFRVTVAGDGYPAAGAPTPTATVVVTDAGREVARAGGPVGAELTLSVADPHLWTPDDPHLYDLHVMAGSDAVDSYAAMRSVSLGKDAAGRIRILLNGRFVFEVGALDQGYWPDGTYTAPTDAALRSDIDAAKRLGFNLLRKHAKVEPDRWYAWADRLGILVWQDVPQAFGTGLTDANKQQWLNETRRTIATHANHPSIVMWTLFNEGWGQHDTEAIAAEARRLDPTRLINAASGGYNQPVNGVVSKYRLPTPPGVGDVNDTHTYPDPSVEPADPTRALVCGEFGGVSLRVPGHVWSAGQFGYGTQMPDGWHLTDRYRQLLRESYALRDRGASAVVYTQLADVEDETNGLLTYDRAVTKPLPDLIAAANGNAVPPMPPEPADPDVVPTSRLHRQTWAYTTKRPPDGWATPDFDAAAWRTGPAPFGHGYPNVGTAWTDTPGDIWLRRTVDLPALLPPHLAVRARHDEDVEVYVDGVLAARAAGYAGDYVVLPMAETARAALRPGPNTLAVHCHQTSGGQVIDVGLTAAE